MSSGKSDTELLEDISEKLDILIAVQLARDTTDTTETVERLASEGFSTKAIATAAGLTPNAVAVRLSRLKRKKRAGKGSA